MGIVNTFFLAFVRAKGAFVGVNVEGPVIKTKDNFNNAYCGKPIRPVEILVLRKVSNPKAAELRAAVKKATK